MKNPHSYAIEAMRFRVFGNDGDPVGEVVYDDEREYFRYNAYHDTDLTEEQLMSALAAVKMARRTVESLKAIVEDELAQKDE